MKTVVILSGGMDSAVLAHLLHEQGHELLCLSFNYGQRHVKELACAEKIAHRLNSPHKVIELNWTFGAGSALTDPAMAVPEGHYAEETMKQTIVPGRNAIMLGVAWGVAVVNGFDGVAIGAHAGDHFIYPDCREDFLNGIRESLNRGSGEELALHTPFLHNTKGDIAREGLRLGVNFAETWTCYKGGEVACGKCGSCVERLEAFEFAGGVDPLQYKTR